MLKYFIPILIFLSLSSDHSEAREKIVKKNLKAEQLLDIHEINDYGLWEVVKEDGTKIYLYINRSGEAEIHVLPPRNKDY